MVQTPLKEKENKPKARTLQAGRSCWSPASCSKQGQCSIQTRLPSPAASENWLKGWRCFSRKLKPSLHMVINNDIDQRPPSSPKPVTNLKSLSLNTSTLNEVQSHWMTPVSQRIPRIFNTVQKVSPIGDAESFLSKLCSQMTTSTQAELECQLWGQPVLTPSKQLVFSQPGTRWNKSIWIL